MSQFQAFVAGMPMSIPPLVDVFPAGTGVNFPKGALVLIVSGFAILATTANAVNRQLYVCVKAVDNTNGVNGAVGVSLVGVGQRVTALIGANTLHPGDYCKISATANALDLHVQGVDDDNLIKAIFIGIEPGTYNKAVGSPFAETLNTNSNPEVNGTTGTIGIFQIVSA